MLGLAGLGAKIVIRLLRISASATKSTWIRLRPNRAVSKGGTPGNSISIEVARRLHSLLSEEELETVEQQMTK